MKASFYNLFTKLPKYVIGYNTRYDTFAILPTVVYEYLINNTIESIPNSIIEDLKTNGFIIEDDSISEYQLLEEEYKNVISSENEIYSLTLLPTLDCNLRCWYCFESHLKGSHLDAHNQESILNHVNRVLDQESIKFLEIELFGGEPLLYFREEVLPLLIKIKETAMQKEKGVSFFFVTNATKITEDMIPMFAELEAKFQISIDGYKEKHNKVKRDLDSKEPTYEKVFRMIHLLCDYYDKCYINLRINYDNETLKHIPELIEDISDIDRRKIGIHLERVWQTKSDNNSNAMLKDTIRLIQGNGFPVSYMNLHRKSISCKASKNNQAVISYDGKVYKCSGRDFTDSLQEGILLPKGEIQWNEVKLNKRLNIRTFDNKECESCKLLPLCWGPCNQKLLETPNEVKRYCQKRNMEISLDDYLYFEFNNRYIHKKLFENQQK